MKLVSVLLCSNRIDEYFYKSIESILTQDFLDLELLVILNGDALHKIEDLRAQFSKHQIIKIIGTHIPGLTYSLNVGLDHAVGKYIARMDADDIAYVSRISTQLEFLEKNPEISVCGSSFNLIDSLGEIMQFVSRPTSDREIRKALFFQNPLCHPTVMYLKKVIRQAGGYQTGNFAEDYNLWVRLARNPEIKFANLEKPLLGYRLLSNGAARRSKMAYKSASTTQWNEFINTGNIKWLLSSILSLAKAIVLGK
ncbi:glycosyltransferase [Polynucleobacter paneuropaeus]|nr:glycosyltransferase [Polynucleobacter paneuropaeus]